MRIGSCALPSAGNRSAEAARRVPRKRVIERASERRGTTRLAAPSSRPARGLQKKTIQCDSVHTIFTYLSTVAKALAVAKGNRRQEAGGRRQEAGGRRQRRRPSG